MSMSPPHRRECPFCRIVSGAEEPPTLIGEGVSWVAFFPLNPATSGHTLVVPRAHRRHFFEIDPTLAGELAAACVRVGNALKTALKADGLNMITSSGRAAEQTVDHLHLHLVPRWEGDNFGQIWPQGESARPLSDIEVDAIRRALS